MTEMPLLTTRGNLSFFLPADCYSHLSSLPWELGLESWHQRGIKFFPVKSGISRHIVRFVETAKRRFAIKETTVESAQKEFRLYRELANLEIRTLVPVGIVARNDGVEMVTTNVGGQAEKMQTGYLVTELMEKVIPDSHLYRRGFSSKNRKRIWDAVIRLFIQMHSNGVYWGDASLANMLIRFSKEIVPELGYRTTLNAMLADAETVEIHPTLSETLRMADVEYFLESMLWTEADLKASGLVRDAVMTAEDQDYIQTGYRQGYEVEEEVRSFEFLTHMDVDKLLGNFDVKGYGALLLKHIREHKWYMSERQGKEVPLAAAAKDWYKEIFKPVCKLLGAHDLLKFFPEKTASSLYVEIMEHKYLMSEREKKDVGLDAALEDFSARFDKHGPIVRAINAIVSDIKNLLRQKHSAVGQTRSVHSAFIGIAKGKKQQYRESRKNDT